MSRKARCVHSESEYEYIWCNRRDNIERKHSLLRSINVYINGNEQHRIYSIFRDENSALMLYNTLKIIHSIFKMEHSLLETGFDRILYKDGEYWEN